MAFFGFFSFFGFGCFGSVFFFEAVQGLGVGARFRAGFRFGVFGRQRFVLRFGSGFGFDRAASAGW